MNVKNILFKIGAYRPKKWDLSDKKKVKDLIGIFWIWGNICGVFIVTPILFKIKKLFGSSDEDGGMLMWGFLLIPFLGMWFIDKKTD